MDFETVQKGLNNLDYEFQEFKKYILNKLEVLESKVTDYDLSSPSEKKE
jgi:hypothetical protein